VDTERRRPSLDVSCKSLVGTDAREGLNFGNANMQIRSEISHWLKNDMT
jgi:hypothetical protein